MDMTTIAIDTAGRGLYPIVDSLNGVIANSGIREGLCHVFLQHTSGVTNHGREL